MAQCTPHPNEPEIAAQKSAKLELNGYTDWFLLHWTNWMKCEKK